MKFVKCHKHHGHPLLGAGAAAVLGAAAALAVAKLIPKDKLKAILRLSCHKANEAKNEALSVAIDAADTAKEKLHHCSCGEKEEPVCFKPGPQSPDEGTKAEETDGLPEPVKAEDVVAQHADSDREAEEAKNKKLGGPEPADAADDSKEVPTPAEVQGTVKKPAARKPRAQKAATPAPETPAEPAE